LIVVGGVHTEEIKKSQVLEWIANQAKDASILASVCTGTFLLASANVIQSQKVTTHWDDIKDLKAQFPQLEVINDVRWVDEGTLITSGGISAGIDMSIFLVSKLHSQVLADKTARQMEFSWTKNI